MSLLDEILNQKARMEEFTPDLPIGVIAGSVHFYRAWMRREGLDQLADPVMGPRVTEVPSLPATVFATETSCYLLVLDAKTGKAVKVDKRKGLPIITLEDKVGAISVALRIMEKKGDQS